MEATAPWPNCDQRGSCQPGAWLLPGRCGHCGRPRLTGGLLRHPTARVTRGAAVARVVRLAGVARVVRLAGVARVVRLAGVTRVVRLAGVTRVAAVARLAPQ